MSRSEERWWGSDAPTDRGRLEARDPGWHLLVFSAAGTSSHQLPRDGTVRIGRASDNDVCIDDASLSRHHARLRVGATVEVEDLGSANGTRVRGAAVAANVPTPVAAKDALEMGDVVLVLQPGSPARREAPLGAPDARRIVLDPIMQERVALAEQVAAGSIHVLLLGETGVGKEVFAELIHQASPRAKEPLVKLNCAALSDTLLESELFGHERGAFTGAAAAKTGLIEAADGGTLLLDEVAELTLPIQAKLLRVIEAKELLRLGALTPKRVDVRIVSATNRDLEAEVGRGSFRRDLFYRLNGVSIVIPPLRQRRAEIAPLARGFLERAAADLGVPVPELTLEAVAALEAHSWPGNVRELRNQMERALLLCRGEAIAARHLPGRDASVAPATPAPLPPTPTIPARPAAQPMAPESSDVRSELEQLEKQRIIEALERAGGNQTQAAAALGMPRRTFVKRLTRFGIPRPRSK